MPRLKPRKLPRQARSKATVDAIVEACARLLREGGYAALTTNRIADLAGVSIGTLYEFFPGKESIVAALTERHLNRSVADVRAGLEAALDLEERAAAELLVRRIVEIVSSDRDLYKVLLRQAPFLQRLPATQQATQALFDLGRMAGERARRRIRLPNLEADTWLIGHMVQSAVLEIAFLEDGTMDRELLTDELVRLVFRMIQGRDPVKRAR
ncbi:MAG: TetR/AcrR family transcriptional regulator [Candidatus Binatia bacterium]